MSLFAKFRKNQKPDPAENAPSSCCTLTFEEEPAVEPTADPGVNAQQDEVHPVR
ncbi:hypothetical protein [Streptomyces sp. H34-S4]|uniref:hypothetical protein n=1 Tax=Streptomyces sp. H34-S4 TaxID=2996463 RepID=UPI00226FFF36|nr:hypothetical protein [Streptomyces sp. H34-S4]MCY0933966.1 hypothetical protein [Streptomyces sp. H34-S4]